MKKKYLLFLFPFYLYAQDLNELIELSLNNQLIKSSSYNVESSKKQYESVQGTYLPKVTIGATYSNASQETITTPSSSTVGYANINMTLYDGGAKGHRYNSLKSNIKNSEQNLESLKNSISLQVINYYFNYLSLLSAKDAKQKEIETLNAQEKRLQKFLEAGTTTSDEVDKIISRVQIANVTLHEIELQIQTILHNLEYLTLQNVNISKGSNIKEFLTSDETLRADIKALEYQMDSVLANAKASGSSNYPMVSLDNTYYSYEMDYDNQTWQSGAIDSQNILKISFAWKLFDFGATNKAEQSVYKQYLALKSKYEYEKNKASVDLKLALKSYEIAKLKITSANAGLDAANSTYDTIEVKYQNGLVENVTYLEALSEKYNAISVLKSAKYDLEIKKANIIYHSGKNLWEYIK
ncbi:MAG: TolC family protein [Campylobacterota bacterium]|nr:TolC family protein [Campylobacterota bacterium]